MTPASLRERIAKALSAAAPAAAPRLDDGHKAIALRDMVRARWIDAEAPLDGCRALILTRDALSAALAMVSLDGLAERMVIAPPDIDLRYLPQVLTDARIDLIVHDGEAPPTPGVPQWGVATTAQTDDRPATGRITEWVLFTSGTTGPPKMVAHTLEGLTSAIRLGDGAPEAIVWATFYDIRRYGGLQMLLRSLTGGHTMLLTAKGEETADFLERLADGGATHVSGTPSHWRNALMHPVLAKLSPTYLRLSGEIADKGILGRLDAAFPGVRKGHAFASTEAGVAFEVGDGEEGFPSAFLDRDGPVRMRVVAGALQVCSPGAALNYVGPDPQPVTDQEGFVDTGDLVEQRGDRLFFMGRANGVINVGGLKAHPEEIEAVLNRSPKVRMALVKARHNPIMGAVVVAEVVLNEPETPGSEALKAIKDDLLARCRSELAAYKIPATIRFVDSLPVTAGGKLERRDA